MTWAAKRELSVHAWTVDDGKVAKRLAKLGVKAIITNQPKKIWAALAEFRNRFL